jgi:G3E family GTPase
MDKRERTVPVYLLSGFLGSGKTTLLKRWLEAAEAAGRKPAVVMNELGEVNLDGIEIGQDVRMAEMLGGCICCTVRGDLGMEMLKLVEEHEPDLLLIESTGAANPLDIIDAVGDASMLKRVELKQVVTVVDAKHLLAQRDKGTGQTFRLMKEQIRCATVLILNKTDLVTAPEADELERLIREWNRYAPIYRTVGSYIDIGLLERTDGEAASGRTETTFEPEAACQCGHPHSHADAEHEHAAHAHAHHSHEHVMAYTRYFDRPVNSEAFEEMMGRLPDNVYRAKGILSFTDTSSRFMFQYAYKQLDLMKINPQGEVPDVAVFIGEHFDRTELELLIRHLAE